MYEHHREPLASLTTFWRRLAGSFLVAVGLVACALSLGIAGYRLLEHMAWIDALLNAAMILGGMGPVNELHSTEGKLFASLYALFSGLVFVAAAGILFSPVLHRFLHRFHLERNEK